MVMPCEGDQVMIGNLICAQHDVRSHHSIFAAQIIGNEVMPLISEECS
jgi:hypothetical protein